MDVRVFGPPYLRSLHDAAIPRGWGRRICRECAVSWYGNARSGCWACGERIPATWAEFAGVE